MTRDLHDRIAAELIAARDRTMLLTTVVDEAGLVQQHSPLMSPLVWNLAHIADQEEPCLLRDRALRAGAGSVTVASEASDDSPDWTEVADGQQLTAAQGKVDLRLLSRIVEGDALEGILHQ